MSTFCNSSFRWDPAEFGGMKSIRIPEIFLWTPDIVLYNKLVALRLNGCSLAKSCLLFSADHYYGERMASRKFSVQQLACGVVWSGLLDTGAMVYFNGTVFWPIPARLKSTCRTDVTYFPFDSQHCYLKFGSWTYHGDLLNITFYRGQVDLSTYVKSGEFDLISTNQVRRVVKYSCCDNKFPDIIFFIHIQRKILFYVYNAVIPCSMLTGLTLLVFWLPPDSGEKITLGVTVLLAFSVFMLNIAERMPETSDSLPLIGCYLIVVMGLTSVSVLMTVLVLNFHHRGPLKRKVPTWMHWLILQKLRSFLGMSFDDIHPRLLNKLQRNNSFPAPSGLRFLSLLSFSLPPSSLSLSQPEVR